LFVKYRNKQTLANFTTTLVTTQLRGFAPELTPQGCSGGESLATCGRFNWLGIYTLNIPYQKRTSYHLCQMMAGILFSYLLIFLLF